MFGLLDDNDFAVGDDVMKCSGDYNWRGTVCAVFKTPNDLTRIVVAHPVNIGFVLHIYSPENLRRIECADGL